MLRLKQTQRLKQLALLSVAACFLLAIATLSAAENPSLLVTGRVWTGDPQRPWADAVLCAGERVLAVGERDELQQQYDLQGVERIDARGGLVTPGWIDSHVHLLDGGRNLSGVQLRDAATRDEFVRRLAAYAATCAKGEWIRGGDWDHTRWGGTLPTRAWIDSVTPDNPVWIQRLDGHMALANSAALRLAGVDDQTVVPEGGAIERDAAGMPTGLLRDNAMAFVDAVVPEPTPRERLAALAAATDYLHACGVTSVVHMGALDELATLRAARQSGALRLRVHAATPLPRWRQLQQEIQRNGPGDEWLRGGMLKGFVDGSLGSHTAAFLAPYDDQPLDRGLLVNTPEDLLDWTRGADAAGLQVAVHAIGDRAIRRQLDVFEQVAAENGPRDRRFRIEHAQHIAPDDVARFGKLGVIASMQPYHAIDDGRWAEGLIGAERCQTTYAFRTLLDTGAKLALGSDWFVAPPTPLEGIDAAVTRRTLDGKHPGGWVPAQKITVEEALRGYTSDAAYAVFAEQEKGQLRRGMLADMTLVDRDLTAIPATELPQVKVRATILGGKVVYRAEP
ncbi:amidohydrolase [Botrimarina hoheduenensis]|uniref:N-substituted formamide deformylase n=1 Tax=Botrimarina hoheduenensis TaxID=2528000 RepID=A0A5C5W8U5_9BACT|nr:amidohydrolase [Botrimarina hoheduenensis]TWT46907.1 N-substituted formamide deformylase precursor [Botrimarina hoheduenensis]